MTEYTAEEFAAECERSAADGPDLRPALTVCRDIILDGIADNFLRQQSSEGVKWPARKANSLRCGFHPLLQLSGALRGRRMGRARAISSDSRTIRSPWESSKYPASVV